MQQTNVTYKQIIGGIHTPGQYHNPYTGDYNSPLGFTEQIANSMYINATTKILTYYCINEHKTTLMNGLVGRY